MFSTIYKKMGVVLLAIGMLALQSCNKEFEDIVQPAKPATSPTIGELVETDASFSLLKAAVTKAGLLTTLKNSSVKYTVFAPDDAAFIASGLPLATVNAMSAAQLASLLSYHVIPQALPSSAIPTTFPNVQMPTILALDPTNPFVKMSIFPSKRGSALYANNIPVSQADITAVNGVIHKVARVVSPPSQLLSQVIYNDPQFTLFKALIARGDVGSTGLNKIDSLLKYAVVNFTVFAPTNAAVKAVVAQLSGGLVPAGAPDQAYIDFINNFVPVQDARGIVVYHIMGVRAFAPNFTTTPTFYPTLLNGAVATHPGVKVEAIFTGPFATGLKVTGVGNGGVAANATTVDKNAVNGVVHIIDMVLLPQ